jgi:hypothetical protein
MNQLDLSLGEDSHHFHGNPGYKTRFAPALPLG